MGLERNCFAPANWFSGSPECQTPEGCGGTRAFVLAFGDNLALTNILIFETILALAGTLVKVNILAIGEDDETLDRPRR